MTTAQATPTMTSTTDRFETDIVLDAPRSRVWRALTDVEQFNQWFGVTLTGDFAPGREITGRPTIRGYEHVAMTLWVETMDLERRFAFRWHPYAIEANVDYSKEPTTLVTFTLEDAQGGTRLTVVESGFDALPDSRRLPAFKANYSGWVGQLKNIQKYLAG
jgi:uncharacterized protein YndB with AHSA1/START domain